MRQRIALLGLLTALVCFGQQNRGYYRYPTLHGNLIVFTAEGDLWRVSTDGGLAQRLTTHPAEEDSAKLSPDGKTIAYNARYEGPTEVYTLPVDGGMPKRRTYDGGAEAVGWTPDGRLLVSTSKFSTLPDTQLFIIDGNNHAAAIPLSQAAEGVYDANGKTLFFTRLPNQGSSTKRYEGGTAEHLWKYTEGSEAAPLTNDYAGTSKNPMWWKGRIYFLTDRDRTMNVWSMDENGKGLRQHTRHEGWDVRSASLSDGRIVYQMGANLRIYDIAKDQDKEIPIELPSDFDHLREHWIKNPQDYLTAAHLAPDGQSVVLTSRGRVFVAPAAKTGRFVDVSEHTPGRFREARLMPDGKSVLVLSTESGEVEFWKYAANGVGAGEQLTRDGKVLRWEGIPSPDGKLLAHQNKDNELFILDVAAKTDKRVAVATTTGNSGPAFNSPRWSPDSRWLLYSTDAPNEFTRVMLYNVEQGVVTPLTTDHYNSSWATWSTDGNWIYFLSDRYFKTSVYSPWGSRQPDPYFDKSIKIYALALKKDQISPFEPMNEVRKAAEDKKAEDEKKKKEAEAGKKADTAKSDASKSSDGKPEPVKVEIDLDGIQTRLIEVPAPPGDYDTLTVAGNRICWIEEDGDNGDKNELQCLDIANKGDKPDSVFDGVHSFEASADGKKLMVQTKNDIYVIDSSAKDGAAKSPKAMTDSKVDLGSWAFSIIPSDEFREAFYDAWRLHRDYFYDRKMHGVNWNAMRDKYGELLGRVRDREELADLISEMVGELSALHTFVVGGDVRKGADQISLAWLGAALAADPSGTGYRVERVYRADPDRPDKMSPLAKPGVDVKEGDVILAINGQELKNGLVPEDLLRNQADKQVLLRVRSKGVTEAHDVVVTPLKRSQDLELRYSDWEWSRRQMVEKAANGRMAYVHLRAMGSRDIAQWEEQFTPQFNRGGLIIDVRHNGGGNIDSWILGKLLRKAWMYWQPRVGAPSWNMQGAFRGPMVVLCDEWTGSDGEAFTEGFRRLGLGKVIGTRTWGGEIWLSFSNALADNGIASAAELGVYGPEGKWLIEGHGVDPDIVVDNLPHATFEGKDAQLDAAIAYLEKAMKDHPVLTPGPPEYPDKSLTTKSRKGASTAGAMQ